jgi:hypothetical protein
MPLCLHCYECSPTPLVVLGDRGKHKVCESCKQTFPRCEVCGTPEWNYREYCVEDDTQFLYHIFCEKCFCEKS